MSEQKSNTSEKKYNSIIITLVSLLVLLIFFIFFLIFTRGTNKISEKEEEPIAVCGNEDLSLKSRKYHVDSGEAIFKAKCATCHSITRNSTGQKLSNSLPDFSGYLWFDCFITNEDSLRKIKDTKTLTSMEYSPAEFLHEFNELSQTDLINLKLFILINQENN